MSDTAARSIFQRKLNFLCLSDLNDLSPEQYQELSELVYDTDPYIYPAMFGSRDNALKILPCLFREKDVMFRLSNCYAALYGNSIVGLVLWTRGGMDWKPDLLKEISKKQNIGISPYLDYVSKEYMGSYNASDSGQTVYLINVCVKREYRGLGIGRKLLKSFFAYNKSEIYELCVLKNNENAVRMYRSFGFETYEEYNGFSIDYRDLPALKMMRKMNVTE